MSLPEVNQVRQRIDSVQNEPCRMFLKATYLLGTRGTELAGERCSGEKTLIYGPTGEDAWLDKTEPPDIPQKDVAKILITAISGDKDRALEMIDKLSKDIPVGIFKIRVAKQRLQHGEEPVFRLIALPLTKEFEPWGQEVFDYFKKAGSSHVFPFNRSKVWYHITFNERIFEGLKYRIRKYMYVPQKGEVNFQVFSHPRQLKIHGLRHVRVDELVKRYLFDGLDLAAFVGWSTHSSIHNQGGTPAQTGTYAEIREMWSRYIKKLCKPNDYGSFCVTEQRAEMQTK